MAEAPPSYDMMFPEKQPLHGANSDHLESAAGYAPPADYAHQQYPPPPQASFPADNYPVAMPVANSEAVVAAPVALITGGGYPLQQYPPGQYYPGRPGTTSVVTTDRTFNQRGVNPNIGETCWGSFEYVPALPIGLAILVFLINIGTAGFGTILGGFFQLCIGNPFRENQTKGEVFGWCLVMGLGQMLSCFFFFVGWFWGFTWGILFIICAARFYQQPFPAPVNTTTTTTIVVPA